MPTDPTAYVSGFEYDLFISYAHVDNLDDWVKTFQKELENRLAQRVGRLGRVRVWRDPSLDGCLRRSLLVM